MVGHLRGGWKGWQVVAFGLSDRNWPGFDWSICLFSSESQERRQENEVGCMYATGIYDCSNSSTNEALGLKLVPEIFSCCMFSWRHIDAVLSGLEMPCSFMFILSKFDWVNILNQLSREETQQIGTLMFLLLHLCSTSLRFSQVQNDRRLSPVKV